MTGSRIPRVLGLLRIGRRRAACTAADWPQFLGPTRNGVSTETGLTATWPKKGPPVVWDKEVGEGYSGPVVVGDRVILFHRVGDEEVVECMNAADGATKWKKGYPTKYQRRVRQGRRPALDAGDRRRPRLHARRRRRLAVPETGRRRQGVASGPCTRITRSSKGFFGVATSPMLEGGRLLVNVGGANGAGIVAFNKDDGKEVWKADDHDASYSSPVAADLGGMRQAVFLHARRIGRRSTPPTATIRYSKHWRSRMDASVNAATPVVVGGQIFLTACYGTGAVLLRAKKDGA